MIEQNEIPKYRKSTNSKVSKSKNKSKHKHEYKDCLLMVHFKSDLVPDRCALGEYCHICGKIYTYNMFKTITENGNNRLLSNDELIEIYNKLPFYNIESMQTYVDLDEKEDD